MPIIESKIMINTKAFKKNAEDHTKLIDEFRLLEKKVSDNSSRAKPKFDKRNQLLPRERVKRLLDPGSYYLPISTLAGYKMGDDDGDKNKVHEEQINKFENYTIDSTDLLFQPYITRRRRHMKWYYIFTWIILHVFILIIGEVYVRVLIFN